MVFIATFGRTPRTGGLTKFKHTLPRVSCVGSPAPAVRALVKQEVSGQATRRRAGAGLQVGTGVTVLWVWAHVTSGGLTEHEDGQDETRG